VTFKGIFENVQIIGGAYSSGDEEISADLAVQKLKYGQDKISFDH